MKGRRRELGNGMRCIGAGVLAMCAAIAYAGDKREPACEEEDRADAQLKAIAEDEKRSNDLIKLHLPFGAHIGADTAQGRPTNEKLLVQTGYVTLHDGDLRTALWTAHRLTRNEVIRAESADRVECFRPDIRLPETHGAILKDYQEPIFDRGHMTPDADLRDDVIEQVNSYILSNMAPQYGKFNQGIWRSIEYRGRKWAKEHETIYVATGALFDFNADGDRDEDEKAARMGSRHQTARVAIASHFYKVYLRRTGKRWCSITFVLEHHNGPSNDDADVRLQKAIKPLAFIEERAETTFHPELDRGKLDESLRGKGWGLAANGQGDDDASCKSED